MIRAIFAFLCLSLAFLSPAQAADTRQETLQRIEHYLSTLTTVTADFSQTAADGSISEGTFYLQRPGKMRWEYKPPTPVLIVSSGSDLVFYDRELEQVSHIPIADSLIGFLALDPIRLSGTITVTDYQNSNDAIRLTLKQTAKPDEGQLTLEFSDNPLQIRNIIVTDATGQLTHVALNNARFGQKLDKELFIFRDPRKKLR